MAETEDGWNELVTNIEELVAAAQALTRCKSAGLDFRLGPSSSSNLPRETTSEIQFARQRVASVLDQLQNLMTEPSDFIQRLAHNTQLLSCLQWLGEFQVLACIPLSGSVAAMEVADLADVSEAQLTRIVRMAATAGFLAEPRPGYIAHTPLSAHFVSNLSYLDATMLLAETAAPAALQMTCATRRGVDGDLDTPGASAYSLAFKTKQSFQSACEQRPRLHRQWLAYLRHTGSENDGILESLNGLGWFNISNAGVVNVGAYSAASTRTLARLNPTLKFIVQLNSTNLSNGAASQSSSPVDLTEPDRPGDNSSRRIMVRHRVPGSPQPIKDAAIYILNLPSLSAAVAGDSLRERVQAELRAHAEVLRVNTSASLILLPDLLSDNVAATSGQVGDSGTKNTAYLGDLSLWQMTNGWGMDLVDLMNLVNGMQDGMGRLVISDKLRLRNGATVALHVKYQSRWGS